MTSVIHPRPQLTRERWEDLCGAWQFATDDRGVGRHEGWHDLEASNDDLGPFDQTIQVPFPPESAASGLRQTGFHKVIWYRRVFQAPPTDRGDRLLLHFGAVDYRASVWVNGRLVAEHEGGHTPFTADITQALAPGMAQALTVRVEDDPQDLSQPRGKQDWRLEPHAIHYQRTSGIWQPVWLERVPETYVQELRWTPDLDRGLLGLQIRLNVAPTVTLRARVRLTQHGVTLADSTFTISRREARQHFALDLGDLSVERSNLLWSPRHPNLIDATVELLDDNAHVLDRVGSYAGLRSVGAANGRFMLNGSPYYLRMVLAQNYWPESHLAAPSPEHLRREVELAKELGFNGVRVHQKVEDPRFLYWCDKLGLLVWGEMANAFVFTEDAQERLTREWTEVLKRDYNHPSVVTWVPMNESWGAPNLEGSLAQRDFVKALYHLTRALDPTRPVIGNDGWELVAGDFLGIHDYETQSEILRKRYGTPQAVEETLQAALPGHKRLLLPGHRRGGEPVMLSEFGGLSFAPAEGERWWGYGTLASSDELLAKYTELITTVLDCEGLAGFCYTQLTDTEQETNGLLKADRTPKLDTSKVRAANKRVSMSLPADAISDIHEQASERERAALTTTDILSSDD